LQVQNLGDNTPANLIPRNWEVLPLTGWYIEPRSSILVVSTSWYNNGTDGWHTPRYVIENYDIGWNFEFSNRNISVALVKNHERLPLILTPEQNEILLDLIGTTNSNPPRDRVDNYAGSPARGLSRQLSSRRVNFKNTFDNRSDFEPIDFRYPNNYADARAGVAASSAGITNARLREVRPRYSGDGHWGVENIPVAIYRMSQDPAIQNRNFGQDSLWGSGRMGVPAGNSSLVPHPNNSARRSIYITDRTANWHVLNFLVAPLGLEDGVDYRITFSGRTPNPGFNMSVSLTDAPHLNILTVANTQANWSISHDFCTASWNWRNENGARIDIGLRAAALTQGFYPDLYIDEIIVERFQGFNTVIFDLDGGTRIGNMPLLQTVLQNGAAIAPEASRSGFVFGGWDFAFDNVTADITVTAQWLRIGAILTGGHGHITSADLTWLARHIANHEGFTLADRRVANLRGYDRNPTVADVTLLARWLVGYDFEELRSQTQ
jgi:hypothetical protein